MTIIFPGSVFLGFLSLSNVASRVSCGRYLIVSIPELFCPLYFVIISLRER